MKSFENYRKQLFFLGLIPAVLLGCLCISDRRPVSAATTFTVTEAGDAGCPDPMRRNCTLRQVIAAANSNPSIDTIRFNITSGANPVKTITPLSELPAITEGVIIDATTQPGYAGKPLIELNGASAGATANGLVVNADNTVVKGLVINRFAHNGIQVFEADGLVLSASYIGTDATGNADLGNGQTGVLIQGGNLNRIGEGTVAARNIISGNRVGVWIAGNTHDISVQGNYIGTNAAGTAALGNRTGVLISGGGARIGGSGAAEGNLISGNSEDGIVDDDGGPNLHLITNNLIGTNASGDAVVANGTSGVLIRSDGASVEGNVIGGNGRNGITLSGVLHVNVRHNFLGTNAAGAATLGNTLAGIEVGGTSNAVEQNTIAFNHDDGVRIGAGTANVVTNNTIFSNNGLGIDLGPDGVTPNDLNDPDTGPNNLQNFPVLSSVKYIIDHVDASGTLNTQAGNYHLEFYSNSSCDPSGNGEGEKFLGSAELTAVTGANIFRVNVATSLPPGRFITVTATRRDSSPPFGDTSEFSPCIQLVAPGTMQFSSSTYAVDENAGAAVITIERSNGSDGTTSVFLTTTDGTATAGQDYTDSSGQVNFANGQTSRTVSIPIREDAIAENGETVNLNLIETTGGAPVGQRRTARLTINDNDAGSVIHFSDISYSAVEDCAPAVITVKRVGDLSGVSTVRYNTASGTASDRTDFTPAIGMLRFEPGETQKTFSVLINEDSLVEGPELVNLFLHNPTNAVIGSPAGAQLTIVDDATETTGNVNDDSAQFVCQHYHDFLNRQPDTAGQNFWTNQIESCGADVTCREIKRINVSAAFFLSIEFQQTGYLVYRMNKAAYSNMPGAPVPVDDLNFLVDTQRVGQGVQVGIGDWQAQLEANKEAFANEFVERTKFTNAFPSGLTAAQFVDVLDANSGGALSGAERNQLINELSAGTKTRAQVLRAVAEDPTFVQAEFNRAFVLMQYFGYLRRDPNAVPDADFGGYNFWLGKLDAFNGNFITAEMVKAFIVSGEYRQRFGP